MRIGFTPPLSLEHQAAEHHRALPGFIRATLIDHGVANAVIERRELGWDGDYITVPVREGGGRVGFFERWDPFAVGMPMDDELPVELYPYDVLSGMPDRLLVAEGVHEALVFESEGFPAVAATGTGRVFKAREWAPLLSGVPDVVLAYRSGECRAGRRTPSRSHVVAEATRALPNARRLAWPDSVRRNGGAYAFFALQGRTREEFEALLPW